MHPQSCLSLVAEPSPHVLPRVFDLLARHGVVPARCHSRLEPPSVMHEPPTMTIDLQLGTVDDHLARRIATGLEAMVEIHDVLEGATCAAG
ncbi:MAG: hypothetical protein GVY33_10825 [Alphaproteobacteria bacterium]|jgi:hypothetical protein|nr:hypothetical protein [Alphaproteobacteria bacterium]